MYSSSPIGLSLCSWNANGLLRRNAELRLFIEKHSPDILLIQETHLRPSHNFNIANYTCHRNDRITDGSRSAGGTLILIKSSLKHYCLPTPPLRALEATNIILTPPKHDSISITSVYIPHLLMKTYLLLISNTSFKLQIIVFSSETLIPPTQLGTVIISLTEEDTSL
ncbi:putative RNA-directed DNA polymerase from transposon X-element [Trichonephila clavipes]|nr:putative RNA-directed DNA polymerase from transposon X-element [Trichonephila clavipes]